MSDVGLTPAPLGCTIAAQRGLVTMTRKVGRLWMPVCSVFVMLAVSKSTGYAQRGAQPTPPQPSSVNSCPGQQSKEILATGVYTAKPVAEIVINGQPVPGSIWQPGERSYWHCHPGGQLLTVFEGVGRVQQRGERARALHKGETEYAGPGVEHWHGAAPDAGVHFIQLNIAPAGVTWMEEAGRDDYIGNDVGIASRNEYLRTGVQKNTAKP
jgi:hypothetical protein